MSKVVKYRKCFKCKRVYMVDPDTGYFYCPNCFTNPLFDGRKVPKIFLRSKKEKGSSGSE